jgi:hypothetical protein
MKSTNKRVELDWAKLMGFNQVKSAKGKAKSMAVIGSKIGAKVGGKPVEPRG